MLVVKRKTSESIVLGDNIVITILNCENGTVKLGIEAPKDITILRSELLEEIKEENEKAININMDALKQINFHKDK